MLIHVYLMYNAILVISGASHISFLYAVFIWINLLLSYFIFKANDYYRIPGYLRVMFCPRIIV